MLNTLPGCQRWKFLHHTRGRVQSCGGNFFILGGVVIAAMLVLVWFCKPSKGDVATQQGVSSK